MCPTKIGLRSPILALSAVNRDMSGMLGLSVIALALAPAPSVTPLGPDARHCLPGAGGSAILVQISGLKNRAGTVRVRVFGGAPSTYFDKKQALLRTEIATPAEGPVAICMPVARTGTYAIDVRHDINNNNKTDRSDGGGASGNPRVSLFDMLFSRKPDPATVQVRVGAGTTVVPVTLMYLDGGSFKPVR